MLGRPRVVVCLHFSQFREIRKEFHELEEELQGGIFTVLGKDYVYIEVLVDEVDHEGQEIVEGSLEEITYLDIMGRSGKRGGITA